MPSGRLPHPACHPAPTLSPRLVTPAALQRKRARKSLKKRQQEKNKAEAGEYHKLLMQRLKEQRERRWEGRHRVRRGPGVPGRRALGRGSEGVGYRGTAD